MFETLFSLANYAAMAVWVALILAGFFKGLRPIVDPAAGTLVPALLSVAYVVLIVGFFSHAPEGSGFGSIAGVQSLFAREELMLAGWLHFLAFDLFVGAWIARTGAADGISPWLLAPILVATFMVGPLGFLAFVLLRLALRKRAV